MPTTEEKPKFRHDCDSCVFLGHFESHDLYFCGHQFGGRIPTCIARRSDDAADYISGLSFYKVDGFIAEARKRAIEKGLYVPPGADYSHTLHDFDEEYVMTLEEFLNSVKCNALIDDDGYGFPVKDNRSDMSLFIRPSEAAKTIPYDATHIIWYNR